MKKQPSAPFYVYSNKGIARMDPEERTRLAQSKLAKLGSSRLFRESNPNDLPTPRRGSLVPRRSNPYLPQLLEPLHDQHSTLELKLSVVEKLWAEMSIPSWYYGSLLETLKQQSTRRQQFMMVLEEIRLLRERSQHSYIQIAETLNARENALSLVLGYFQKETDLGLQRELQNYLKSLQGEGIRLAIQEVEGPYQRITEEPLPVTSHLTTVLKHIKLYRQLTIRAIELIWQWSNWLKKHHYPRPPIFFFGEFDYFDKISEVDARRIELCSPLFDKHPLMLVKKQHQKTPFAILWRSLKPTPEDAIKILTCMQVLSMHSAALLKGRLADVYDRQSLQPESPRRHRSLIERLYKSDVRLKPPMNYLDRKHPVYITDSPQALVQRVRHKPSLLLSLSPPQQQPISEDIKFKDKLDVVDDMDQQKKYEPQAISDYALRQKEYEKIQRVRFQMKQEDIAKSPQKPLGPDDEEMPKEREEEIIEYRPPTPELVWTYCQLEEDRVLEFLENLFLERERPQNKIDYLLRTVLSHRSCIITKVSDQAKLGRDKLVGLIIGQQCLLSNGQLQFLLLQLIPFNKYDKKFLLKQFSSHLEQYCKYSSLSYKSKNILKTITLKINLKLRQPHLLLQTTFKVTRQYKPEIKQIAKQYPHLGIIFRNRERQKHGVTYNQETEKYQFKFSMIFNFASTVKIIKDSKQLPKEYLKVTFDKIVQLAVNTKGLKGRKLIIYGVKESLLVFYPENGQGDLQQIPEEILEDCEQLLGTQQLQTDVLFPTFSVKLKYMGSKSSEALFRESLSLTAQSLIPLSLIRSLTKYSELLIPDNFILRVLTRQGIPIFSRIFNIKN